MLISHSFSAWSNPPDEVVDKAMILEAITLQGNDLRLRVEPQLGARVSSLSWKQKELLYSDDQVRQGGNNNWGSTLWLSPQSLWGWPPVAEHDQLPYRVTEFTRQRLSLQGPPGLGAAMFKSVYLPTSLPGASSAHVDMHYRIRSQQHFDQLAAWEVTRVARRGLVLFSADSDTLAVTMGEMDYRVSKEMRIVWLQLGVNQPLPEGKLIANGVEGWLAWVDEGILYAKIYPPVAAEQMASGEGDIEIYISHQLPYMELEVQSAAHSMEAGQQLDWTVRWLVAEVPDNLTVTVANRALFDWVRQQIFDHR